MKHSTGSPTKAEAARLSAIKQGECMACRLRGIVSAGYGIEAHHLLSGGKRIGHMATIGLCCWHHRGVTWWGMTKADCVDQFGPSLADGSRPFRAAFGSDSDLLAMQNAMLDAHIDAGAHETARGLGWDE